ncbi:MAG TPA: hypothetical protein VG367_15470 [Mucilaginibacter sp.]|jgi:hypothetical protein|nr:hypothetical protein [Mucilaginibacter sp.]
MGQFFNSANNLFIVLFLLGWVGFLSLTIYEFIVHRRKRYNKSNRLVDVIRLISAMGLQSNDFKKEESIVEALRGKPLSSSTWHKVAEEHPEFFRPNGGETHYALLQRSYLPVTPGQPRDTLKLDEVQKLFELAGTFHEKEVQQSQRYILWFPLIAAAVAAGALLLNTYLNNVNSRNQPVTTISQPVKK